MIPRTISNKPKQVRQLAVGEDHLIILMGDGSLMGVGSNQYGQLGFPINRRYQIIEQLRDLRLQGLNEQNQEVVKTIVAGQYLNIVMTLDKNRNQRVMQFGKIPGAQTFLEDKNYILSQVQFKNKQDTQSDSDLEMKQITKIYARYDTNIAISENKLYVWGDNLAGTILTKPKLLCEFDKQILSVAVGQKHGLILTKGDLSKKRLLYGWGDGTYGELGFAFQGRNLITPERIRYFDDQQISQIAAGGRHSLILNDKGQMFVMGDNTADQCATTDRRVYQPQQIYCEDNIQDIYCGSEHNAAVTQDDEIYTWGGSIINKGWGNKQINTENAIRLEQMEDIKRRQIEHLDLSYSNTIIITASD